MLRSARPAPAIQALAIACGLIVSAPGGLDAGDGDRPSLAGTWTLNKSLSTPAGSVPTPDGGTGPGPVGDRIGRGIGGRRGGFGPGGAGGGAGRGGGDIHRREADRAARRGLMEELMAMPPSVTIVQDGDRLAITEPDGVVRVYHANDRSEKHQLVNGTIETKTRWDDGSLVMELKPRGGLTIIRRFTPRPGAPAQLEIATRTNRDKKGVQRIAVYEHTGSADAPATAPDQDSRSR